MSTTRSVSAKIRSTNSAVANSTIQLEIAEERKRIASLLSRVDDIASVGYWEFDLLSGRFAGSEVSQRIYGLHEDLVSVTQVRNIVIDQDLEWAFCHLLDQDSEFDETYQIRRGAQVLDLRTRAIYRDEDYRVIGLTQDITQCRHAEFLSKMTSGLSQDRSLSKKVSSDAHRSQSLREFEHLLFRASGLSDLLPSLVTEASIILRMAGATVWNKRGHANTFKPVIGHIPSDWKNLNPLIDVREKLVSTAVESGVPLYVTGPDCESNGLAPYIKSFGIVPLGRQGNADWALEFGNVHEVSCTEFYWKLLDKVGAICAAALEVAQNRDEIREGSIALSTAFDLIFESWSKATYLTDTKADRHTQRVGNLAVKMAGAIGLAHEDQLQIRRGALLHNIVSYSDQHRRRYMKWLSGLDCLAPALAIAASYREHWDGTGLSQGLQREAIPFGSRILAVAHEWDVLTQIQPSGSACSDDQARDKLQEQSGKIFDPVIVERFIDMVYSDVSV